MIGILEDADCAITQEFKQAGDIVLLLGELTGHIGGTEYLKTIHGKIDGEPPHVDLSAEANLYKVMCSLTGKRQLKSAHDSSDGGVAITLAECCFKHDGSNLGAEVTLPALSRDDFALFGEQHSVVVISASMDVVDEITRICEDGKVKLTKLGKVGGLKLMINNVIDAELTNLRYAWENGLKLQEGKW